MKRIYTVKQGPFAKNVQALVAVTVQVHVELIAHQTALADARHLAAHLAEETVKVVVPAVVQLRVHPHVKQRVLQTAEILVIIMLDKCL